MPPLKILVLISGGVGGSILAAVNPYLGLLELLFLVFGRPQDDRPSVAPLHIPLMIVIGITIGLAIRLGKSWRNIATSLKQLSVLLLLYSLMVLSAFVNWTVLSKARVDDFGTLVFLCVVSLALITTEKRLRGYVLMLAFSGAFEMIQVLRHPSAMVEEIGGVQFDRLAIAKGTTVFGSANYLALFMALTILLCTGLLSPYRKWWQRIAVISVMGGSAYVFFRANSRGASLGLAAGAVMYWFLSKKKLQGAATMVLVGVLVIVMAPGSYWARLQTITNYQEDESATNRLEYWNIALKVIPENPVLGIGPDNFYYYAGNSPHNAYLQMAVEVGLPAMLLYFGWLSMSLWFCWRAMKMAQLAQHHYLTAIAKSVFCCLVVISVQGFTTGLAHREVVYVFGAVAIMLRGLAKPLESSDSPTVIESSDRLVLTNSHYGVVPNPL